MIYPVPHGNYNIRKKKRRKLPWILFIVIIILAAIISYILFSYNTLFNSDAMQEEKVDFLFFLNENKQIIFIREDMVARISYIVSFPSISYEPIRSISTDYDNPKDIYSAVEKLYGEVDKGYYASMNEEQLEKMYSNVGMTLEYNTAGEVDTKNFIKALREYKLSTFEFLLFSNVNKFKSQLENTNKNKSDIYRLLYQLQEYARKETPMKFITKKPVIVRKLDNINQSETKRLYIDEKELRQIKEFME